MGNLFRVFFSSTFSDFVEERNALHKHVFPKLKEYCASRSARFQPIDLRWGIPDEVALNQSTMQICLDEIKRCQDISPRPNFIVFLGERYGWCPPPVKIPKTEFDVLSNYFTRKEKSFIESWYLHDENELWQLENGDLTTVYELQAREKKYKDFKKWSTVEAQIREILFQSAKKANFSKAKLVKYFASATHQEIIKGALNIGEAGDHVHCFFRKLDGLPKDKAEIFQDKAPESIQYLSTLKEELRVHLPSTIHEYNVNFDNELEKSKYLEEFCNEVQQSLENSIKQELEEMEEISIQEEEIQNQIEFAKNRTKVFMGREKIIQKIAEYVKSESRLPYIIRGEPGSGKSALLAKLFEVLKKEVPDAEIIIRFIGTSLISSNSVDLLRSICEEITHRYEVEQEEEIPYDYYRLCFTFSKRMVQDWNSKQQNKFVPNSLFKNVNVEKPLILIIDGIDQLPERDKGRDLAWLSTELPKHVKIITSYATDDKSLGELIEKRLSDLIYSLESLEFEKAAQVLDILLLNNLRRLTSIQKTYLLGEFMINGLPLYLKLAFEQARTWNSYDDVRKLRLAQNVNGMIQQLLERLYSTHTEKIVKNILSFIVTARNGLTEDEILDIMTADSEFFNWYTKDQIYHALPEKRLPWIVWSRLYSDIKPYITERGVDNTSTISFFHRQFNDAIYNLITDEKNSQKKYHGVLSEYFAGLPSNYWQDRKRIPNFRKASEWNYHLLKMQSWEKLVGNLTSLEFMDFKCAAGMTADLQNEFLQFYTDSAKNLSPDSLEKYYSRMDEFRIFFFKIAHLLRKYLGRETTDAVQLIGQLATSQPEDSLIYSKGIQYLDSFNPKLPWFGISNESILSYDHSICTYTGHLTTVTCCAFTLDGERIISGSMDTTLRVWDVHTGQELFFITPDYMRGIICCALSPDGTKILLGCGAILTIWDIETRKKIISFKMSTRIWCCAFSPDGKYVISGHGDKYVLNLWDVQTGNLIHSFTEHTKIVSSCAFSPDGTKIVSGSGDETMILWDVYSKRKIRSFLGNKGPVRSLSYSPDGTKILSASWKNMKIWDVNTGQETQLLKGHTNTVNCCVFSPDGKQILSSSFDKTLKLWDVNTGKEIHTYTGNPISVICCTFSPDGTKILSGSKNILKLWDAKKREGTQAIENKMKSVMGYIFSPDETAILSRDRSVNLTIWDVPTGKVLHKLTHPHRVAYHTFSPDGKIILTGVAGFKHLLKLWDAKTGQEIRTITGPSGAKEGVVRCEFSPDGKKIISCSEATLILWNAETGQEIRKLEGHSSKIKYCKFSPNGSYILSQSGEQEFNTKERDPNKRFIHDYALMIWDGKTGHRIHSFSGNDNYAKCFTFSPDSTALLSGFNDGTLKLWDLLSGNQIYTLNGHSDSIERCVFSPNGNRIVSGSRDTTIKVWDRNTGQEISTFYGHEEKVSYCAFSPDGSKVFSGSADNTVRIWNVETANSIFFPFSAMVTGISVLNKGLAVRDFRDNLYILRLHSLEKL